MKLLRYRNRDVVLVVESYKNRSLRLELIDIDTGLPVREITADTNGELPYGFAEVNNRGVNGGIYQWLLQMQIISRTVAMNNGNPITAVNMFRLFELDGHGSAVYQKNCNVCDNIYVMKEAAS